MLPMKYGYEDSGLGVLVVVVNKFQDGNSVEVRILLIHILFRMLLDALACSINRTTHQTTH